MSYMQMGDMKNTALDTLAEETNRKTNAYSASTFASGEYANTFSNEGNISGERLKKDDVADTDDRDSTLRCNTEKQRVTCSKCIHPQKLFLDNARVTIIKQSDDDNVYTDVDVENMQRIGRKLRPNFKTFKTVIVGVSVGLICGIVISSVCWLTVDKLKETRILCEYKSSTDTDDNALGGTTTSPDTTNIPTPVTATVTTTQGSALSSTLIEETVSVFQTAEPTTITNVTDVTATEMNATSTAGQDIVTTNIPDDLISTAEHIVKRSIESGHVYIRWGRTTCPSSSALVYKGFSAGGQHQGGATNTLCFPEIPTWGNYNDDINPDRSLIHGTEYQTGGKDQLHHNVPCCVCQASGRLSRMMVPGRVNCFPGWNLEYTGYLMGSEFSHLNAKELICVDREPEHVDSGASNNDGNLLYFEKVRSGSLKMPQYVQGRELACAVCTQ